MRDAGEGKFFDSVAATGARIKKGQAAWPQASISMVEVPIRDRQGFPRGPESITQELRGLVEAALGQGRHISLHLLGTSQDRSQHLSGAMHWCTFRARFRLR